MNYIQKVKEILRTKLASSSDPLGTDDDLLGLYALLVLVKGINTTLRDIHDAWALWCVRINPTHPSIVPFPQLTPAVQQLDFPYRHAIIATAKEIGRG